MPPKGSPDKEPGAPSAPLAHIPVPINSLTNSPTSSSGSGSMLDWTTSAGSSDMFDLTSPPNTFTPVLVALPTPPSTAQDASPGNGAAAPPHIAVSTSTSDGGAHTSALGAQRPALTINWDELTFPTDWISPSPSVSGEARISRPSSTAPSAHDVAIPRELVDKAFSVLHHLSEDDLAHDSKAAKEDPTFTPAQNREEAPSPSANSRRKVTSVGTPSRRPLPVPTVLNEDEEAPPAFQSFTASDFNFFVERNTVVNEDDDAHSDYYYRQLRPSDSVMMPPLVQPTADDTPNGSTRSASANSALSYFSPPVSPRVQQFVDAFRLMGMAPQAGDRESEAASRPSTRSSSPPSPQVATSAGPTFIGNQNEQSSSTRSIPVGSILSAASSTDSESRVPKPQHSSASLASLLQSYGSLDASTVMEPEPSRGRQRYRRDFPQPSVSLVIQPSGLPSYAQTESTAASNVNLVPDSPTAVPVSSSSSWTPPQPWTGMSVTQPLAASEPLTQYGRKAHPLPPTPPIPSQTANMFTSQPLYWTEPLDSSTGGSVATDASGHAQRAQRQRPPLPPVPVDQFAQSGATPAPPVSAYMESLKFGDRAFPAFTETLPSMAVYMPPTAIPSGFQPWASNAYSWSHARAPWSPLAHNVSGTNGLADTTSREQNDHSNPLYSANIRVWSPLSFTYQAGAPPIAPQPVPAPPAFIPSPATYAHSDRMSANMMNSPNVSATSPFIPSLNDIDADNAYPYWTGHPAPTGVRFISPLPSPPSATPSTPRPAGTEFGRQPWAQTVYHTGEREDRDRRQFYDTSGVRFAPPVPPPPPSSYTRDERDTGYSFYAPVIPVIPPHLPPMPPTPSVSSDSQWTTNSRRYAFTDASVAFKVEQTLFKVHRSFFERHSSYFRRILAGYSYGSNPISLPDIKKLDFERLLSIFYPSDLSKPDITTLKGWLAVLALSQKWEMDQIKRLCVRHIGHLAWPMEKVIIAHKYGLHNAGPSWLFAAYKEVCTRSVPLALRDAEQLSMEIVVNIWEVQHEVSTMRLRGESIEMTEKRVEELVKEKFGHFEVDTPPTTPTGRMPSFSSW